MSADHFAGRLRELREEKGLSREQLAEQADVSIGLVRDLEQGRYHPSWASAIAFAEVLGVPLTAFLDKPADVEKRGRGRPKTRDEAEPQGKKSR